MLTTPNISEKGFEVGQPFVQGGHTVVQGGQPFVQGGQPFVHSRVSHTDMFEPNFNFVTCHNYLKVGGCLKKCQIVIKYYVLIR